MNNNLRKAVEQASKESAIVYVYKTGECNVNAAGLSNVLEASGHDVVCEIDCTNVSEESFDEDGEMFDACIDEILERYEEELEGIEEVEIDEDEVVDLFVEKYKEELKKLEEGE